MIMIGRLSLQSIDFIKNGNNLPNANLYHNALKSYQAELTSVIGAVCEELKSLDPKSDWSQGSNDAEIMEDEEENQTIITLSNNANCSIDYIFDKEHSCSLVFRVSNMSYDGELLEEFGSTPAFKRYFQILEKGNQLSIKTKIGKRQLTSRHLCDYLLHLSKQFIPFFNSIETKALLKAA